jgi:Cu+-exporting ATPase
MRTHRSLISLALLSALAACKADPPPPATAAPAASTGVAVKEIAVTEKGYQPNRVEVEAGKPVVLRFTRRTTDTCGEAVVVQGDPVSHMLPVNRPVDIKVTAPKSGELTFACGMDMMHGVLHVR